MISGVTRVKKVVVVVQDGPFNTVGASEAFRMGLGLTLAENQCAVLLVNDGVYHLLPLHGEKIGQSSLYDFIEVFEQVGLEFYADTDAVCEREIGRPPRITRQLSHAEVFRLIRDADVVIPFR